MFGGAKPPFGAASTSSGFGTGTSPFGAQSAFSKPATPGFGQTSFGQQANTSSLFGGGINQASGGGLFGTPAVGGGGGGGVVAGASFGTPVTTQSGFGSNIGGFGQTQSQNTSLFGGTNQPAANTSLFGQSSTSAFGAAKPTGFGFGQQQPTPSLFGQQGTSTAPGTAFSGFGTNTTSSVGMFGATTTTAFGQQQNTTAGSSLIKYQPSLGTDTLLKNGQTNNVSTKQHCITAMKEYEAKSLEEIRLEDYMANRKGPQVGGATTNTGLFGTGAPATNTVFGNPPAQAPTTGLFGQPQGPPATNTLGTFGTGVNALGGGFGQQTTAFGQTTQNSSLFAKPFGTAATISTAPFGGGGTGVGGGFGTPAVNNNPFGAKPFGQQTTSLFGQPATTGAQTFGQQSTGFPNFGQPAANQQPSLFGTPATVNAGTAVGGFGLGGASTAAPNAGFGFNANTNTNAAGSLFGAKTIGGFGTPLFGGGGGTVGTGVATTSTASGFGTFGQTNTSGSLFNSSFNKQAVPSFGGFGTQTTVPTLGAGIGGLGQQTNGLFGNTINKPLGGGFFGQSTAPNSTGLFGSTFGQNNTIGGLGQNTLGIGQGIGMNQQQPAIPVYQQIMAFGSSPYGDNAIFKDLKPLSVNEDALKPTNPAAQKPILESALKFSPKISNDIKLKPIMSMMSKKPLFNGLEEYDSSVESFTLKPNAKRLIIKPKNQNKTEKPETSNEISSTTTVVAATGTPPSPATKNTMKDVLDNNNKFNKSVKNNNKQGTAHENTEKSDRRASWLHSKELIHPIRNADYQADNTINELIPTNQLNDNEQQRGKNIQSLNQDSEGTSNNATTKSVPISANDSTLSINSSGLDETILDISSIDIDPNPAGVILHRAKYYIIPPLDKLVDYMGEDGSCIVPNLTIGRKGYGNVYFNEPINIAGLNLDELVHFRHKEVIIYPGDENKPPIGTELNRKAQITLDQVWPHDKTLHEPIKDRDRLEAMDFERKLRRVCDKHDMRFIEYRPETGSWVFRVNHFSKYGLNDSDEDDIPADPKKVKLTVESTTAAPPPPLAATQTGILTAGKQAAALKILSANNATGAIPKNNQMYLDKDRDLSSTGGLGGYNAEMDDDINLVYSTNIQDHGKFQPTRPSATLAMDMGTDSHKVQLMKASFFHDDDYDGKSVISEQFDGRESPDQIVPNRPSFLRPLSSAHTQSKGPASTSSSSLIETPIESPSQKQLSTMPAVKDFDKKFGELEMNDKIIRSTGPVSLPLIVKPTIALIKLPGNVIPLQQSIGSQMLDKCVADIAFMRSRSFKIGWSNQNKMFLLNTNENCPIKFNQQTNIENIFQLFAGRHSSDRSHSTIRSIQLSSSHYIQSFCESIEIHLKIQLDHCQKLRYTDTDCPQFIADGKTQLLHKHHQAAIENLKAGNTTEYVVSIWSLCNALWSDQEILDGYDHCSHQTIMQRKELLSEWLEDVVPNDKKLEFSNATLLNESGYLNHLLELLSCHKVDDASELAFNNNDLNLALLIAQLSGGPTVRQLIHHQLAAWQDVEADKYICIERLKVFMLLAGIPLLSSAHGTINIYDDFDWLKSFALHIWYLCSATSSITDALIGYEKAFKSDDFRAMSPIPPYTNEYQPERNEPVEDLRYHILKLYSKRSHPLDSLLNPVTHAADPMDFRLSWLLLEFFKTIGYHHCPEYSECQLHTSFASQLENYGLWHWSIFVLLHIPERQQRELSVQRMLYRYVTLSTNDDYLEKERFIVEQLDIPLKWIYWAKAVRAGALNKPHAQADYLLKAKQWSMAHDVIMNQIAPDAVINDNINYLRELLERFDDPRQVPNWSNQGLILLDFMDITKKFESLKTIHEDDIETRWEGLKPQLSELFSRINQFPCPTSKHRLCQSEIAQRLANLVSGMRIMCPELDPCILTHATLRKLPLPQEYSQQQIRGLIEDHNLVNIMEQGSA